ncbi:MAG: rod shape-determining protein [Firmicutes bacterium]|nr:rod shape-determining protein [Bacillota bacterium]
MNYLDIAIDIGTSNTRLFVAGEGIVLNEPTLLAFNNNNAKKILAFGKQAKYMLGKTPKDVTLVAPVAKGVIVDGTRVTMLLKEFFNKIFGSKIPSKIRALVAIPIGLSIEERHIYESVIHNVHRSIKQVTLIENVLLSGIGAGLSIDHPAGGIIVNIGGGITEIATLSMASILGGCGLAIGGDKIDELIIETIERKNGITIGLATAQKVKKEIASLHKNNITFRQVDGVETKDTKDKTITSAIVKAIDIYEATYLEFSRIAVSLEQILNLCPLDAVGELNKRGVYIMGGTSRIEGLAGFMTRKLDIKCFVLSYPEYTAIKGAGKLLANPELMNKVLQR